MATLLRDTLRLIRDRWPLLLAVILLLDLPLQVLHGVATSLGWLPPEAADPLIGLVGLLLLPLSHGAIIRLVHQDVRGREGGLADALATGWRSWSALLTAYMAISFYIMGWLAVLVLPAVVAIRVLEIQNPLVLAPFALAAFIRAWTPLAFMETLIVVEGATTWQARPRSRELARGQWPLIIGGMLLTMTLPLGLDLTMPWLRTAVAGELGWSQLPVTIGLGLALALLDLLPVVFFYVLYRKTIGHRPERSPEASQPAALADGPPSPSGVASPGTPRADGAKVVEYSRSEPL